ncbi:MAG TPA: beta-galactosidase trimerization domain-containing protein [Caldilineaceae bacterium]|nr:beta-galactosidase trimerization domain-containing protein [Caldilineaceae bacterium]
MAQWWETFPWRQIQTNLREIDMQDINAAQVVKDLQSFNATVLMINAAGIIASYPTELPFHFQSPYLTGDSLADIIEACHAAGIRVVARTDFSKVRRPIYEQHPEWAYISPAGEIVDYNGDVAVCINGAYQQEYALRIIEECLTKLDFDGIFFNMGGYQTRDYSGNYYGPCQCDNCRRAFDAMFGLPLPTQENMDDPLYRKYVRFKQATLRAHHEKVYNFIHSRWPHIAIANHREFGEGFIRQESNTAIERPLPHWQYSASDNTKWATTNYPAMVSSNTTVDFIDFPYRHVAVSPHQQSLRLVQSLANGGALDYYLIGRLDNHEDRSGYAGIREIFAYHAAHEADYGPRTSKATVAVLHGPHGNLGEFRGWFRILAEHHFLFDTLLEETALSLPWDKYRAIVLPDFQGISDALAARLDDFVAAGGALIASGRSGLRDEHWEPRAKPVLKSLGIAHLQYVRNNTRAAYFKFEHKDGFPRMAESDLVYLDGLYIYAHYVEGAKPHMKMAPPQPFGPPERTYSHLPLTDHPGFVVHPHDAGKAIHLPWLPGALFHRQGYPNTSEFIADLLEHIAGVEPVGGNLSPMVEVTHFASRDGAFDLVHLVNGSGHFGVSFFAPLPMQDLEVCIAYPKQPQRVRSLVTDEQRAYTWQDGRLTLRIPRLDLFEALRIE